MWLPSRPVPPVTSAVVDAWLGSLTIGGRIVGRLERSSDVVGVESVDERPGGRPFGSRISVRQWQRATPAWVTVLE
jgi:hypothetical protein